MLLKSSISYDLKNCSNYALNYAPQNGFVTNFLACFFVNIIGQYHSIALIADYIYTSRLLLICSSARTSSTVTN